MAFKTNQSLTTLLLQNLNVRTNANTPISSLYAVYTNGQGQTYWGPSINPVLVSTLFLSIADNYVGFSTYIEHFYEDLSTTIGIQGGSVSTIANANYRTLSSQLYTTNISIQSSVSSLLMNDSTLFGTVYSISIDNSAAFAALSNTLALGVYTSYISTINNTTSTIYGVSSLSTFYNELGFLLSTTQQGLSSISTSIQSQTVSTLSAFTGNVNNSLEVATASTTSYTTEIFSSLSTYIVYANNLSTFSSILTQQLLSTSDGLYTYITYNDAAIYDSLSSIHGTSLSTISTVNVYNDVIIGFLDLSTNMSSISYNLVSSFLSTTTSQQLSSFSSSFGYLSTYIFQLYSTTASYSTFLDSTLTNINSTLVSQTETIDALEYDLSAITTSSILNGVYKTFRELEIYTETILNANSTAVVDITTAAYKNAASSIYGRTMSKLYASSFYVSQTINLTQSTFIGLLDFTTYTHFNVNIYSTINGSSNYTLDCLSNINTSNYKTGNLFINVSTVNQPYSNNNGKLVLDAYRWGYPTWQTESVCPSLSNSDYTLHYTYTIQNSILYTSLLNVYPRLDVYGVSLTRLQMPSIGLSYNFGTPTPPQSEFFWRGEQLQVNWSNYSFLPIGQSNYNPMVSIDVLAEGTSYGTFGPFTLDVSTAVITMPYIRGITYNNGANYHETSVRIHVVGKPMNAVESTIGFTIVPYCERILLSTNGTNFLMGNELVGITDIGSYPTNNIVPTVESQSGFTSYDDDVQYGASNLFNGILNNMGALGDSNTIVNGTLGELVVNGFTDSSYSLGYPNFLINIGYNALTNLSTLQGYGSQITATFSDVSNTFSFVCQEISTPDPIYGYSILSNNTLSPYSYTFTLPNTIFKFGYTPVLSTYTTDFYTELNFIGPSSIGNPDPSATMTANISSQYPLSTLTFYNITDADAPTYGSSIAGNIITTYTPGGPNGYYFTSTFVLTNSQDAQVFRM